MNMQRILVFGASSQVGHFLLPSLVQHKAEVWAISRRPHADLPGIRWTEGRLPDHMPDDMAAWDGIISAGPLTALGEWLSHCATAPARALVAISSMSVVSKQASIIDSERALMARMLAGEQTLAQQCERLGVTWVILRPTLIYGAGLDRNLTPLARRARRWRWFALPAGKGLRQPVHAADVAEAARRALICPEANGKILSIGGGERLSVREMFARTRENVGVWTLPVPVWGWMQSLLARALPWTRGPISRLNSDLVADNTEVIRVLGTVPRAFMPTAEMWDGGVS